MESLNLAAHARRRRVRQWTRTTAKRPPRWVQRLPRVDVEPELHAEAVESAAAPAAYVAVGASEQPEHVHS
jgi:hypothetical protein